MLGAVSRDVVSAYTVTPDTTQNMLKADKKELQSHLSTSIKAQPINESQTAFTLPSQISSSVRGSLNQHNHQLDWLCTAHISEAKRIEAFCTDCRLPLCMGCILTNAHTTHSIVSLPEAAQSIASQATDKFATVVTDGVEII